MSKSLGQKNLPQSSNVSFITSPSAHESITPPVSYADNPSGSPLVMIPTADGSLILTDWNDVQETYTVTAGVPFLFRPKSIDVGSVNVVAQW